MDVSSNFFAVTAYDFNLPGIRSLFFRHWRALMKAISTPEVRYYGVFHS